MDEDGFQCLLDGLLRVEAEILEKNIGMGAPRA